MFLYLKYYFCPKNEQRTKISLFDNLKIAKIKKKFKVKYCIDRVEQKRDDTTDTKFFNTILGKIFYFNWEKFRLRGETETPAGYGELSIDPTPLQSLKRSENQSEMEESEHESGHNEEDDDDSGDDGGDEKEEDEESDEDDQHGQQGQSGSYTTPPWHHPYPSETVLTVLLLIFSDS